MCCRRFRQQHIILFQVGARFLDHPLRLRV
jgi:hypothetical protein